MDRKYSVEPRITGNTLADTNSHTMSKVIENATEPTTESILDVLSRKLLSDVSDENEEGKRIITDGLLDLKRNHVLGRLLKYDAGAARWQVQLDGEARPFRIRPSM